MKALPSRRLLFGAALLLFSVSSHAVPSPALTLTDDRGQAIAQPLDLCFQVELRSDCRRLAPGEGAPLPSTFYSLRVEGEDHGPLTLRREELTPAADGSYRLAVPRKAWLRIETGALRQPLSVSLFSPQDSTFRQPAFRRNLKADERELRIPAGDFIVSLAMERKAPDLSRLNARPAARLKLAYTPREGWSLLARFRAAATGKPVSAVQVTASESRGYSQRERRLAEEASGADGLVLLSGLQASLVSLSAHHPDFISADRHGLSASPGALAFREVDLDQGGRLVSRVTVHGKPWTSAKCEVYAPPPEGASPREPSPNRWAGSVDDRGVCRSDRLPAGVYKLRVLIPEGPAQVSRWVTLPEGEDREEEVALTPTRVSGEIRRARQPAPGYTVETLPLGADPSQGARAEAADAAHVAHAAHASDIAARAVGDEAGKYELTLWTAGRHSLVLRAPSGSVATRQELTTTGEEERQLDFDLDGGSLHGVVVDTAGRPVGKAWVDLKGQAGAESATTDAAGAFEIDVEGEGAATLTAGKAGYRSGDPVDLQLSAASPPDPVRLVLQRKSTVQGRVLAADGTPVAGASVASLDAGAPAAPRVYRTTEAGDDGSFEIEAPPGPARVFVSGPGCPLSAFPLPAPAPPEEPEASAPPVLRCPGEPAAVELTLVDDQGNPLPHAGVILLRDGAVVPQPVLADHLRRLGLTAEADGTGHLLLAGLAPGNYELFVNTLASESSIAAGSRQGFLTALSLGALETDALQVTLPPAP